MVCVHQPPARGVDEHEYLTAQRALGQCALAHLLSFAPTFARQNRRSGAVRQIVERGDSVADVSQRLGVSSPSLYKWVKAVKPDKTEEQAAELIEAKSGILRLRTELRCTEEARDILFLLIQCGFNNAL